MRLHALHPTSYTTATSEWLHKVPWTSEQQLDITLAFSDVAEDDNIASKIWLKTMINNQTVKDDHSFQSLVNKPNLYVCNSTVMSIWRCTGTRKSNVGRCDVN